MRVRGSLVLISVASIVAGTACSSDDSEPASAKPLPNFPDSDVDCEIEAAHEVPNEGADHVAEGSVLSFDSNPPASGAHYPVWTRFEAFDPEFVPRGYWVHNLEHGGIALLAGPDASERDFDELLQVYDALPEDAACGHKRVLLTRDPELTVPIAVVAWNWVMLSSCTDSQAIADFVEARRGRGLEDVCGHGRFVP